jgi:hypothetical protein
MEVNEDDSTTRLAVPTMLPDCAVILTVPAD